MISVCIIQIQSHVYIYVYIYIHIYRLLAAYMATGYLPVYISLPKPINHLPFNSEPPHHSVVLTTCLLVASLFFQRPHQSHMSHEKKTPTFHYTGWLIGILIMVHYNPYITGFYNPLNTLNNQVFFHCSHEPRVEGALCNPLESHYIPKHHDVRSYPQTTKPPNLATLDLKVEVLAIWTTCHPEGDVITG